MTVENRENLSKLYFELASDSRLAILDKLSEAPLKIQEVARCLDVTATEAFRQLERLNAALLVARRPDGAYTVTPYGGLVMQFSLPLGFLLKHKEYFTSHNLAPVPTQFINRLGELSSATYISDTMESLNRGQRMFMEAKQYGWGLAEGVVPELMGPVMTDKTQQGVKFRFLIAEDKLPPSPLNLPSMEIRGLSEIPAVIAATEKEAAICFRRFDGKMDYSGFYGSDPQFRIWAQDLFLYFWGKGKRM